MIKHLSFGAVALGIAVGVASLPSAQAAGISSARRITEVRLFNADGGATFNVDGAALSTNCNLKNSFRVTNETVVRGLVSAYLAGKPVKIKTTDKCDAGNSSSGNYDNASEVFF